MHCTIDGRPESPEALACQERHFGQATTGIPLLAYEISMPPKEFIDLCGPLYVEYVDYEKRDEPYYRAGQEGPIDRWHRLGYPPLDHLLREDPEILEHLLRWRMGSSLLRSLFPTENARARFVLNTLDTITVGPDRVVLAGRAWEL